MSLFLPDFTLIFSGLVGGVIFLLGLWVLFKDPKKKSHRVFFLLVFFATLWILGVMNRFSVGDPDLIVLSARATFAFASLIGVLLFYFSYLFLRKEPYGLLRKWMTVGILVMTLLVFSLCLFTPYVVETIKVVDHTQKDVYGVGYYVFGFWFVTFFVLSLINLFLKRKKLIKVEKTQTNYILAGLSLSTVLAFFTNVIIPSITGITSLAKFSPLALLFFIVLTAYAITKHHLFDIRVIATEVLVGLIALVLFVEVLLADGSGARIFKGAILAVFVYLGWTLIKSVLREIERRKKMERMTRDLQEAYAELKELDEAKSEFIAMASHQLRTPLTVIKGLSSMILEGTVGGDKTPKKVRKTAKDIFESNERLVGIVNDLLDISKADLGKLDLEKEEVKIQKLIGGVVEELRSQAEEKGLEVVWEPSEQPGPVSIDPLKMRQVVFNVVDNAIKYTEEGRIEIRVREKEGKVRIEVEDTGEGMTEEEKEKIFESFTRGRAGIDQWVQGTGLGLYLAKKYVELHGGGIWANSEGKGKGSTFYIEFPENED